jgi:hypothetical protein
LGKIIQMWAGVGDKIVEGWTGVWKNCLIRVCAKQEFWENCPVKGRSWGTKLSRDGQELGTKLSGDGQEFGKIV